VADVAALLDDRDPSVGQMARLTYGTCAASCGRRPARAQADAHRQVAN
jgi:hypothetical protein